MLSAEMNFPNPCLTRPPAVGIGVAVVAVLLGTAYLLGQPRQSSLESRALQEISRWMTFYPLEHPGQPMTNLTHLFASLRGGYPYWLHEQFRAFGKKAGFEHSLVEKYVFVQPPIP